MRAEGYAAAAVDADKGLTAWFEVNRIHRTGFLAFSAVDAKGFLHNNPSGLSLGVGPRGTGNGAGSGSARQAGPGLITRGEPSRGTDADPRRIPGKTPVHQTCASQGTAVATDASFHSRCGKHLHDELLMHWRETVRSDGSREGLRDLFQKKRR